MKALLATMSFSVLVLAGCATLKIHTEYDRGASFSGLNTYAWLEGSVDHNRDPAIGSPLLEKSIRDAVDRGLKTRGYRKVDSDSPDFWITYQVVADPKVTLYATPSYGYYGHGHLYGHGYGSYGYPSGGYRYYAREYREYLKGTLILDIIDARSGESIWRGWAVDSLDSNPEPAMVRMYINEPVERILERFPPGR